MPPPRVLYTLADVRGAIYTRRPGLGHTPHRAPETGHSTRVQAALQLQRTVGNVAFRSLLQRDPTLGWDPTKANKGFKRTRHTSPNRTLEKDGVKLRNVLINGLKHGLTEQDANDAGGEAVEDTIGKAVVWMPEVLKPKDPIQVLLHLHGFGTGYRELTRDKSDYAHVLRARETRDEDLYHLPEQLAASMKSPGRQVVAVLPQGRGSGSERMFGNLKSNPTAYLNEVFQALKDEKVITDLPSSYTVVLTGHSGAGPEVLSATRNLEKTPKSGTNFGGLSEVVMFDAINGSNELEAVRDWLKDHIANDVKALKPAPEESESKKSESKKSESKTPEPKKTHSDDDMKKFYADKTRFRGYFTHGYASLYGDLPTWIPNQVKTVGKDLDGTALKWLEWQYRVIGPIGPKPTKADPYGPHEHLLATPNVNKAGLLAEVLDTSTSPP